MAIFKVFKSKKKKLQESKYNIGMSKTRSSAISELNNIFSSYEKPCDELFDDIEEVFVMSDVGVDTTVKFVTSLRNNKQIKKMKNLDNFNEVFIDAIYNLYMDKEDVISNLDLSNDLNVFLFVGVNGVGKTTSIAKIANKLKLEGKKVLLAAADTFRAGAVEQLKVWGERIGCDVVFKEEGSDPASVIYDATKKAKEENYDVLLCDTAGRLQNKVNLMKELEKINRVISREIENGPHETLLVIDATTGQNGMSQAKVFNESTSVSGVILTKLDGTAKGGVVLAIKDKMNIPIKFVGLGEKIDDLKEFDIEGYIYGMFQELLGDE